MIKSLYNCFKHWSDRGGVYIISDTHFADNDCLFMDPYWPSPDEQVQILNKYVHKCDTLIHLGDVGDPSYIDNLKAGYKILITGNHDVGVSKYENYFDEIYDGPLMISKKIILSHEPVEVPWAFNIHGHDHNKEHLGDMMHINVCANVVDYIPVNLGYLIKHGVISKVKSIHRQAIDKEELL